MGKKLISTLLDEFKKEHPLYNEIRFEYNGGAPELLHPIFTFTQYIIDEFIRLGEIRIAFVLPDNDTGIVPMVVMNCFDHILNDESYTMNLADNLKPGDHLRVRDAVVEFIGIDKKANTVKFYSDNPRSPQQSRSSRQLPINTKIGQAIMNAEKTNAEITSSKRWKETYNAIMTEHEGESALANIKAKRTLLNKTILLMTQKGDLRELFEDVKVGNVAIKDILSFGKINLRKQQKFELYNNGRLIGIPAITVTSDMEDTAIAVKQVFDGKVGCIFVAPEKSDEMAEDEYNIKKCLQANIPIVVFLYEKDLKNYMQLKKNGFKIWHWKPATMKSEAFMTDSVTEKDMLFGTLSDKINCATLAEIKTEKVADKRLKNCANLLFEISCKCKEYESRVRKIIGALWKIYKDNERLCYVNDDIKTEVLQRIEAAEKEWNELSDMYEGQEIVSYVNRIILSEREFLNLSINRKQEYLERTLKGIKRKTAVIMPDGYPHPAAIKQFVAKCSDGKAAAFSLSEFEAEQNKNFTEYNTMLIPWFDKEYYIEIKQLYCYGTLLFVLYDFEDKRRRKLIRERDEIVPYEQVKDAAEELNIIDSDYSEYAIDESSGEKIMSDDNDIKEDDDPIDKYDFRSTVRRNIFSGGTSGSVQRDSSELVESILVFFEDDKYGYFYPTHKVFDVTKMLNGIENAAYMTEVKDLKPGAVIAESTGDKDIIREIADRMMTEDGKFGVRDVASGWLDMLAEVAKGRSVKETAEILNGYGADCSEQQCRIWLAGETIMPRKIEVLRAIGKAAEDISEQEGSAKKFQAEIENVFECGSIIHGYHQTAGRELKKRLAQKAEEIRSCAATGMSGTIEGIGAIRLYKVEDIDRDKYDVERGKLNKIEEE